MKIDYFERLKSLFTKIVVTDRKGKIMPFDKAIFKTISLIKGIHKKKNKIIFIGNGGSASIASHICTDFLKNATIPAITFNDPSLITCVSNDFSYVHVFQKPLETLALSGDLLFAISSSGKSENILCGTTCAKNKKLKVITLSGFDQDNPLRRLGEINFYVPSAVYGFVEIVHLAICHYLADAVKIKPDV